MAPRPPLARDDVPTSPRARIFPETLWRKVTHGAQANSARCERAQAEFYRIYWRPVFCLVCRYGYIPAEAEDLTEEFLLHFLQSGALSQAHPAKGRLRDFIAASLDHYLVDRQRHVSAQKRGGKFLHVGLDDPEVKQLRAEATEETTQDRLSQDDTLLAALPEALSKLEGQYAHKGRGRLFRILKQLLLEQGQAGYAAPARALHCSPATLRSDAKRFRSKLCKLLRAAVKPSRAPPAK